MLPDTAARETAAMRRAVELAARGLGTTSPNPVVGCVVLDADGEVVGEGFHERAGGPHAEVVALDAAGVRAKGGTAVVTLEPCDHHGRTGPCSAALLAAEVSRVVYAVADPDPQAAGGAATLAEAGLDVDSGLLADEAERVNRTWLTSQRLGRPHVTWKVASTLDGRVAAADGSSRWITGAEARADVHRLRARVDAVLIGTGTALRDDPALTVRDGDAAGARQPLRVVLGHRRLAPEARLNDGTAETLLLDEHEPATALAALHERGVVSVLLEGGPTVATAFLRAGLVDDVVTYVAPALLGAGPSTIADLGVDTIERAVRLALVDVTRLGDDVRITAAVRRQPEGD